MTDTTEAYEKALADYTKARADVMSMFEYLRAFGRQTQSGIHSFISANFRLSTGNRAAALGERHKVDLSKWPDGQTLQSECAGLAQAFNAVHEAYRTLPADEKKSARPPPLDVDLP
jgi:hypothetical protein